MPRLIRQSIPGAIWHITHRCHNKSFLLKGRESRRVWIKWLFEACRRYGLRVLNYTVTRNHIHLLVYDRGTGEISMAMQLLAGRTAQVFNQHQARKGAFWEARYYPTLVASDEHFQQCLAYIDLNMVRAGVVRHPADWPQGGYHEIQRPKSRYRIIDHGALMKLTGLSDHDALANWHRDLVALALSDANAKNRQPIWTESFAVGSADFVTEMEKLFGVESRTPRVSEPGITYITENGQFR